MAFAVRLRRFIHVGREHPAIALSISRLFHSHAMENMALSILSNSLATSGEDCFNACGLAHPPHCISYLKRGEHDQPNDQTLRLGVMEGAPGTRFDRPHEAGRCPLVCV